jgi:hypothetical protein
MSKERKRGVTPPSGVVRVLRVERALADCIEVEALWAAGTSLQGLGGNDRKRELEAAVDDFLRHHGTDDQRHARRIAEAG